MCTPSKNKAIKINHFFMECGFENLYTAGNKFDEGLKRFFIGMHPSQWIGKKVKIPIYKIRYSYFTARGNYRIGEKYFMRTEAYDSIEGIDILADMYLRDWVEERNKNHPYKKISNVEILDIEHISNAVVFIQE